MAHRGRSLSEVAIGDETTQGTSGHLTGHILLAEDDPVNRRVVTALLEQKGHRVTSVINGRDAVNKSISGEFDLIFMDCDMPVLDGFSATRAIRDWEKRSHCQRIPIIALTAYAMTGDAESCLESGMDDYLRKPLQVKVLEECVLAHLAAKQGLTGPEAHRLSAHVVENQEPVFNEGPLASLLEATGPAGPSLVRELIDEFLVSFPKGLQALSQTDMQDDSEKIRKFVHLYQNRAGQVGAVEIQNLCRLTEAAIRKDDLGTAAAEFKKLPVAFDRCVKEMKAYRSSFS